MDGRECLEVQVTYAQDRLPGDSALKGTEDFRGKKELQTLSDTRFEEATESGITVYRAAMPGLVKVYRAEGEERKLSMKELRSRKAPEHIYEIGEDLSIRELPAE